MRDGRVYIRRFSATASVLLTLPRNRSEAKAGG
jgi:hypothetical protein